ncbi:hypothetical protein AOXY_G2461 [Acipenser oxyrinchus oxyrinchus]|uniref:Uncharacterized protein n=1 Tax=Acipenser oxyrinchus oxyrinchus TaxID=40147 RepID=A0AAD8LUF2_ACIOX|nr:hypothetical protein AOXY_G2461 [Acipenser oxyrinchus oxyrinchus]
MASSGGRGSWAEVWGSGAVCSWQSWTNLTGAGEGTGNVRGCLPVHCKCLLPSSGGGPLHLEVEAVEAAVDGTVGSCWCSWLPSLLMVSESTASCSSVCGRVLELSSRGGSGPM